MRLNVLKRGLLHLINDCAFDSVSFILAFTRTGNIDSTARDCLGKFLHDFTDAQINFVLGGQGKGLRRDLRGDALPGIAHAKDAPRYVA